MPAITADPLKLRRLPGLDHQEAGRRPVTKVVSASRQTEGEGFVVRRPFPGMDLALADPFLLLDQMGEVEYAPGEAKGAPWHPHRGFETVTYMIDGAMEHTDSAGGGGLISGGATQWMTAGPGIMHSEMPPRTLVDSGGLFHGVQLWVNLPSAQKWARPRYQGIAGTDLALLSSHDGGALVRVIAGNLGEFRGPGVTHTPILLIHATITPGAELDLPWPTRFNALAYSLSGSGRAGPERKTLGDGQLAVFGSGNTVKLAGNQVQDSRSANGWDVLILGGLPIKEPVARYGPFVMNNRQEIIDALEDFNAGRIMKQNAEIADIGHSRQGTNRTMTNPQPPKQL